MYYFRRAKVGRVRLPDAYGSAEFWKAYELALSGQLPPRQRKVSWRGIPRGRIGETIKRILLAARQRAKAAGCPFDLDYEWAIAQVEAQQFRCALTGIAFYSSFKGECRVHPYGPSFDRINPAGGYVRSNVRIVCFAVNVMLMDWGEFVFQSVVNHYRANRSFRAAYDRGC